MRVDNGMARSVSYVSAAKLVSMARGNPRLAIIDVRYARSDRLACPVLRLPDLKPFEYWRLIFVSSFSDGIELKRKG